MSDNKFLSYLIGNESYADVPVFLEDPEGYLDYNSKKTENSNKMYTEPLSTGGEVYIQIERAGKELMSVNAYTTAIALYQAFEKDLETIRKIVKAEEQMNIDDSISQIKINIIEAIKQREEYNSKRKAILSKYSSIIKMVEK